MPCKRTYELYLSERASPRDTETASQAATVQGYETELINKFCDSNIEPATKEDEPPQIKIHSIPNYKNIRKSEISSSSTPRYFSPPKQIDSWHYDSYTPTEYHRDHYLTPNLSRGYLGEIGGGKKRSITLNNPQDRHLIAFKKKRTNSSRIGSLFQGIWKTIFGNERTKKNNKSVDGPL